MANISTIQNYVQENVAPAFYEKVAQAPLLNLPGVDIRTGVADETIDLIHPTISLTKTINNTYSSKTSADLFSQNQLKPEASEERFDLPLHAVRKTFAGNYGSDQNGAFLESPEWLSDFSNKYLEKLDVEVEKLVAGAIKGYIEGGSTGNAAGASQFDGVRTTLTLANPTTAAIAATNINNLHTYIQAQPQAVRTGGGNMFLAMNDGDLNIVLRSLAVANNFHIQPEMIDGAVMYDIPYSNVKMVSVNGLAAGESFIFDAPNMVVKIASDINMDYFARDDQFWVRPRVWVDANFGFYSEVTTTIAALS